MKYARNKLRKAFTLVELAVVVAVAAVLTAIVVPVFFNLILSARLTDNKITVKNFNDELSIDEAINGKPGNVIDAFEMLFNCGYTIENFMLTDGNILVYDTDANSMLIYSSDYSSKIYPEERASSSINAAYYAVNSKENLCIIGAGDIETAVDAGFTQFYLYSTESTITVDTQSKVTLWIYTEAEDVQIIAENAVVYHNKSTADCISLNYISLSDSSYNTVASDDSSDKTSDTGIDNEDTGTDSSDTKTDDETEQKAEHTHEYGEWEVIYEATCTQEGLKRQTCSCGAYVEDTISKLEHEYSKTIYESTVDSRGFTTYTCTLCQSSYDSDFTDYLYTDMLIFEKSSDGTYYIVTGISNNSIKEIYIPSYYKSADDGDYLPVKEIKENAFNGNTAITHVTIGCIIEKIGDYAFYQCGSLTKINIPANLETFGTNCFYECTALSEIYYEAISANDTSGQIFVKAGINSNNLAVYISNKVKRIPQDLFNTPVSTQKQTIQACVVSIIFEENSVCTEIAKGAFYNILTLKTIVLPSSIETIVTSSSIENISGASIYFMGTSDEWSKNVLSNMLFIGKAYVYYYSQTRTTGCWYYDSDGNIMLW